MPAAEKSAAGVFSCRGVPEPVGTTLFGTCGDDPFCSVKARVPSGYLWLDSACFSLRHKGFGGSSLSVAKEAKVL